MTKGSERKASWAQPSLSRDFALLSVAILFIMLLVLAWVAWLTYVNHTESVTQELVRESERIERTLESNLTGTSHLLVAVGRQISGGNTSDLRGIAQTLQAFVGGEQQYALWNWSDATRHIVVSSKQGILQTPVDISDRDYIPRSIQDPWQPVIGQPVQGRLSNRWVIPVAIGATDAAGKYEGTLTAAIDVADVTEQINQLIKHDGVSFAVVSIGAEPLTVASSGEAPDLSHMVIQRLKGIDIAKQPQGMLSQAGLIGGGDIYAYYMVSPKYPYVIVVGYDNRASNNAIRGQLWPRALQVLVVAGFLLSLLWIIRARVIKPVVELSVNAGRIARGDEYRLLKRPGSHEIEQLASQLGQIGDYIAERHLVEDELRNKIVHLHRHHQRLQMEARQRAALLAGLLSEYKKSLRNINAFAQALKDQVHGPIEDPRYRQAAADIHQSGTTLELMVRKLIALSRVDAAAVIMRDERVGLSTLLESARRFAQEGLPGGTALMLQPQGEMTDFLLQLDSLHAQQALGFVFLHLAARQPEGLVMLQELRIPASKGDEDLVLVFSGGAMEPLNPEAARQLLEEAEGEVLPLPPQEGFSADLHITLASAMLGLQQITLALVPGDVERVLIRFPAQRVVGKRE